MSNVYISVGLSATRSDLSQHPPDPSTATLRVIDIRTVLGGSGSSSGIFQRIVTCPVDVYWNSPMNCQWHSPMYVHFVWIMVCNRLPRLACGGGGGARSDICMCRYIYIYICVYIYVPDLSLCYNIYIYIYICIYIYIYNISLSVSLSLSLYIYIYIYIRPQRRSLPRRSSWWTTSRRIRPRLSQYYY